MRAFIYDEDTHTPQHEAWLQWREVAEYLVWWRLREALEDTQGATND